VISVRIDPDVALVLTYTRVMQFLPWGRWAWARWKVHVRRRPASAQQALRFKA